MKGIPPIRSRRGPRRRRPGKLHAGKGYDYRRLRKHETFGYLTPAETRQRHQHALAA
ncbi:hypothetical protein SUDANB6_00039 [Streptomyces sp. enrichment culture]